jgi:hypothetical protein
MARRRRQERTSVTRRLRRTVRELLKHAGDEDAPDTDPVTGRIAFEDQRTEFEAWTTLRDLPRAS